MILTKIDNWVIISTKEEFGGGCMQLTKTQCWDVIRKMVSDKYRDHSSFVGGVIGDDYDKLAGNIKRVYLNRFGFETEADFKYLIKNRGVQPKKDWLDNLSSEDLLIFLDYFNKSLQDMYFYYKDNKQGLASSRDVKKTFERDTKSILQNTPRHQAIKYNTKRLKATGRPEPLKGEVAYTKIGIGIDKLQKQAIIQTMANIAYRFARFTLTDIEDTIGRVITLKTHTTNLKGFVEGYINDIKLDEVLEYFDMVYGVEKVNKEVDELRHSHIKPATKTTEPQVEIVGFNKYKFPICMKGDKYVDIVGNEVIPDEMVYDRNMNPLEDEEEQSSKPKYVGLDIQGTPIYEDEYGYISSTGERIAEEDLFIDNTQDGGFGI